MLVATSRCSRYCCLLLRITTLWRTSDQLLIPPGASTSNCTQCFQLLISTRHCPAGGCFLCWLQTLLLHPQHK
jgi:hypothetical protein